MSTHPLHSGNVVLRRFFLCVGLALALFALIVPSVQADFGFKPGSASIKAVNADGTPANIASSHPYALEIHFEFNTDAEGMPEGGNQRSIHIDLPPGLIGNPSVVPVCPRKLFEGDFTTECVHAPPTQLGTLAFTLPPSGAAYGPFYNVAPTPGFAAQFGFNVGGFTSIQYASLREDDYGVHVAATVPTAVGEVTATIWGVPADPGHDPQRSCVVKGGLVEGCPSTGQRLPFITLPANCDEPPEITVKSDSVQAPGVFAEESATFRNLSGNPASLSGCDAVPFDPTIAAAPTTNLATNPSGLDFELKLPNQGLTDPGAIAETEPKKTVVTLPEGVSVNPSFAESTGVCTEAQLAEERADSSPAEGCPDASKLGSVIAQSPLLEEPVEGSVYLAEPYANRFGTLAALYLVARAPERGILVKQAGKVEFDPETGQITTTFDQLPPVPYSSFKLHFREGARAPLVTPPACGTYETEALLTPFSAKDDSEAFETSSSFEVGHGPEGGDCPSGGLPPFRPGLAAGTINNTAGSFSPFAVELNRTDSEQEINHFSIKLPPGLVAKLAGVPFCTEAQIAAAKARERVAGGAAAELASPSCPEASAVGRTLVGAGVGSALTYVPGKVYLAGPYNGAPISIVAITAAKVGPFDVGTVLVRQALRVHPETGEVFVDATGSDPIPHILAGVPVHLRDIRAYVDRPDFALNPTSCAETSTASTVLGSGLDFTSAADDNPVVVSTRFQAADCAALPFKPKLTLKLAGSTKRAGNPALKAHLAMNGIGEAGLAFAQVALPKTLFLDNAHIGTVCTRVQFKEGAIEGEKCPAGSVIGSAKAVTPILDEPLEGPVYLRANGGERELPDIAASLHGQKISVVAVGYTDSAPGGGLRNTFEVIPDAPVSSVDVNLFGGKRGLIESSRNLCSYKPKATVKFRGHNGKRFEPKLAIKATGCKKGKRSKKRHR